MLSFLNQGMSAKKLALTLTLGIIIGVMPLMGTSTYVLAALALIFKLNMPAIQLVNYAVYFFQIALYVPFLKLGQSVFHGPALPFDLSNLLSLFQTKFWDTFNAIWEINLLGLALWAIVAIPVSLAIYYISLAYFVKKQHKMK